MIMAQRFSERTDRAGETSSAAPSNVFAFPGSADARRLNASGKAALDFVQQAADAIAALQDEAQSVRTQAQRLCQDAIDRIRLLEQSVQDRDGALSVSEASRAATEIRLHDAELRARQAEARVAEMEQALARIEMMIQSRLVRSGTPREAAPRRPATLGDLLNSIAAS